MKNEKPHFYLDTPARRAEFIQRPVAERAKILFGDKYKFIGSLTDLEREFPKEYAAAKQAHFGTLQPNQFERAKATLDSVNAQPRTKSKDEFVACGLFPEEVVLKIQNGDYVGTPLKGTNIGDFAKANPVAYAQLQLAAAAYGRSGRTVEEAQQRLSDARKAVEVTPVETAPLVELEPHVRQRLNLPEGVKLSEESARAAEEAFKELLAADIARQINEQAAEILSAKPAAAA